MTGTLDLVTINQSQDVLSLESFLKEWDRQYKERQDAIPLFKLREERPLNKEQKIYFAKVFYHLFRMSIQDILWFMGNYAPDKRAKDIIVENIKEELGGNGISHEHLYLDFAKSVGADLSNEYIEEETYPEFARNFNKGIRKWFQSHDWDNCISTFAAYERLDNIEYNAFLNLAETFGVSEKDLIFFKVHCQAKHFEHVSEVLVAVWEQNPNKVKEAFTFVANHELEMLQNWSNAIYSLV
jgi:pyrroloquinoline quinone (PQQ) biosynthesis protein C